MSPEANKPLIGRSIVPHHLRVAIDLDAAEREGDAARHRIGPIGGSSMRVAQFDFGTARPLAALPSGAARSNWG